MNATRTLFPMLTALAALLPSAAQARSWHFSPDGSGNTCVESRPCALPTAVAQVRTAAPEMRENFETVLADGHYFLSET